VIDSQEIEETRKAQSLLLFERQLKKVGQEHARDQASGGLWLSHHWPEDYAERCVKIGSHHVCRRCAALYPLGIIIAFAVALGVPIWPNSLDPAAIWILSIPATFAYVGEALGFFKYNVKLQVGTTLIAAAAFGKGLSYELLERWSPEFWQPIFVFGLIWFLATMFNNATSR